MDLQEEAARAIATDLGMPDEWRRVLGTGECQRRAASMALNRFTVAVWDETGFGRFAGMLGYELKREIRERAAGHYASHRTKRWRP